MTRRGPSSITSTRPKEELRSKTICEPVRAQAKTAATVRRIAPALVKRSFLILHCCRVTATAPRVSIGCLALLLGVLFSTTADAASKRVGVPKFDGIQEALVRKKVMQILKAHGYDLAKSREMEIGLANTGALLDNDEGFAKVAKELALSAIVTGEIGKKRAKITVRDGKDGALLGDANFAGANPRKIMAEVGRDFWKKLGGEIARGKAPSGAKKPTKVVAESPEDDETTPDAAGGEGSEPAPEPEPRKKAAEPVAAAAGGEGEGEEGPKKKKKKKKKTGMEGDVVEEPPDEVIPPTFELMLGGGFINRSLAYRDDISMPLRLRPYSLPAGPAVVAHVVWYPLGPFTDGAAKNLGIEGHIEQGFFISSTLAPDMTPGAVFPNGAKFSTAVHEYSGGVRYRMIFGAGNYLFGSLTGGEHAFTFHSTSTAADMQRGNLDIPDTIYRFIRPGVGLHVELGGGISAGVAAGFRWVFNKGGQFHDEFFKRSSVNGVDAQFKIGYRITPMFEARAIVDWRRYFSAMNCFNGLDAGGNAINGCAMEYTAGGAIDQYFSGSLAIAMTMGGTEIAGGDAEAPPPPPKRKRKVSEDEEPGAGGGGEGENE